MVAVMQSSSNNGGHAAVGCGLLKAMLFSVVEGVMLYWYLRSMALCAIGMCFKLSMIC